MEPTHIMVHLRAVGDGATGAVAAVRHSAMTCGCAESTAFEVVGSAPSADLADATHTIWQLWYAEGLYRQWRNGLVPPKGVDIVGFLELAVMTEA